MPHHQSNGANQRIPNPRRVLLVSNENALVYHGLHPREIRLVTIRKGEWTDKIYCNLHHSPLANKAEYKALSYAWGSPRLTQPIFVNGHKHHVTVNLENALRRLRQLGEDLILWVDAICINQSNNRERTEQVNLMHDIFSFAEEVIVYLGEVVHDNSLESHTKRSINYTIKSFYFDDRDEDKLECFRNKCVIQETPLSSRRKATNEMEVDILSFIRLLANEAIPGFVPFDISSTGGAGAKYQHDVVEGLRQLLLARWWNRLWVIQEVVVPKKVTMMYGCVIGPWDMFFKAARWKANGLRQEYSMVLDYFSSTILDTERMRELWRDGEKTHLLQLLRRFNSRKASDDRDKVYGLLSLARKETKLIPNYGVNVSEVFQHTVLDIIASTKSLLVFSNDIGRKDRRDLPSWVPDWSAPYDDLDRRRGDYINYAATCGCEVYVHHSSPDEWAGVRSYLTGGSSSQSANIAFDMNYINSILGDSKWIEYLPSGYETRMPSEQTCLAAADAFLTSQGKATRLQAYEQGVIGLSGFKIDTVVRTADIAFSEEMIPSVTRNCARMAYHLFQANKYSPSNTPQGLGDAFRRTVCADIMHDGNQPGESTNQRCNSNQHGIIATFFAHLLCDKNNQKEQKNTIWTTLCGDLGDWRSFNSQPALPPILINSTFQPILRKRFFITHNGIIGLGPPKTEIGDDLYVLLGGQAPFILREAGTREIHQMPPTKSRVGIVERNCSELIGDCYAHGFMDGEALESWGPVYREQMVDKRFQETLKLRETLSREWDKHSGDLLAWKQATKKSRLITTLKQLSGGSMGTADKLFERLLTNCGNSVQMANDAEQSTLDLSSWNSYVLDADRIEWLAELIGAGIQKRKDLESKVSTLHLELKNLEEHIQSLERSYDEKRKVYLI